MTAGSRPGESLDAARLREGQLALGVWLPLALADLLGWTSSAATMGKVAPGRADVLDSWGLPNLARAVRADDERARQDRLEAFFKKMATRATSWTGVTSEPRATNHEPRTTNN